MDGRQAVVHSEAEVLADRLRGAGVPTVEVARYLGDYNLNEWDCLITRTPPVHLRIERGEQATRYDEAPVMYTWRQEFPARLSVISVLSPGELKVLDAYPREAEKQADLPNVAVVRDPSRAGTAIRKVDGLRDSLDALVARDLVPAVKIRDRHMSFRHWTSEGPETIGEAHLTLTPFLLGPDDVVLAASYPRNGEASVWLLPEDISDLFPWIIEALRDWHDLYPDRFPALPDWRESDEWRTAAEVAIAEAKAEHLESFKVAYEAFQLEQKAFEDQASEAKESANRYQRALLSADGPILERAVEKAIRNLGFRVVDMDQVHTEGDRREDLRVYDDDDPEWVAIVEVKGGKGGAKENELHGMGKWATRYAVDEGREPSAQWFVVNHQRLTDPSVRPTPFGNKSAVAETFAQVDGSIIDTRALFDLLRLTEADPSLQPQARALLKAKPPVLTRVHAGDLDNDPTEGR